MIWVRQAQGGRGARSICFWRCDRYCRWLDCSMPSYGLPGGALMLTLSSAGERLSVLTGATGDVGLCSALGDAYAIPGKDRALGPRYRAVPPPQFVGTSLCASEPLYMHVQNRRAWLKDPMLPRYSDAPSHLIALTDIRYHMYPPLLCAPFIM
jgi:hypothetical protein